VTKRGILNVAIGLLLTVAAVVLVWLVVLDLPSQLSAAPGLTEAEIATSRDAIRASLVQAVGGALVALGLVFTARTFTVTPQSHITERYTAAISQLGDLSSHVRLGGIYALERIANDSRRDEPTITEILCALVRSKRSTNAGSVTDEEAEAATRVIGRLPAARTFRALDLREADLSRMDLSAARLAGADLSDAKLVRTQLGNADLRHATLARTDLTRATLDGADRLARQRDAAFAIPLAPTDQDPAIGEVDVSDGQVADLAGADAGVGVEPDDRLVATPNGLLERCAAAGAAVKEAFDVGCLRDLEHPRSEPRHDAAAAAGKGIGRVQAARDQPADKGAQDADVRVHRMGRQRSGTFVLRPTAELRDVGDEQVSAQGPENRRECRVVEPGSESRPGALVVGLGPIVDDRRGRQDEGVEELVEKDRRVSAGG
jgi:hypothetical protein